MKATINATDLHAAGACLDGIRGWFDAHGLTCAMPIAAALAVSCDADRSWLLRASGGDGHGYGYGDGYYGYGYGDGYGDGYGYGDGDGDAP